MINIFILYSDELEDEKPAKQSKKVENKDEDFIEVNALLGVCVCVGGGGGLR